MAYSGTQAVLYDTGVVDARLVVRLQLANDLYLVSHADTNIPNYSIIGTVAAPAIPCITNISDIAWGFIRGSAEDFVAGTTITALNVKVPLENVLNYPSNPEGLPGTGIRNGRLGDYLMDVMNGWGSQPAFASIFYTISSQAQTYETEAIRHYIFRGLLYDFEVVNDGREVMIRLMEDLRWNRRCPPYSITQKVFLHPPKENVGLPLPIMYGNFGLWSMVGMESSTYGPLVATKPWFPACMNGAFSHEVKKAPDAVSGSPKNSYHVFSASNTPGAGVQTQNSSGSWQALFLSRGGSHALVNPAAAYDGSYFESAQIGADLAVEFTDNASFHDLKELGIAKLGSMYKCVANVIPVREADSTAPAPLQGTTSLTSFSTVHARESAKIIDGDVLSYLRDDVSTNGTVTRRVTYELSPEDNLGSILEIRPYCVWRLISGSGTVTFNFYIDYASVIDGGHPLCSSGSLVTTIAAGLTNRLTVTSADLTDTLRNYAPQVERWEFRQDDAAAVKGRGMRFTATWTKSVATTIIDIIQCGLLIKFNPSRMFEKNEAHSYSYPLYDEEQKIIGRVDRVIVGHVTAASVPSSRPGFYVGFGQVAETGFPGTYPEVNSALNPPSLPSLISNPAEIIRHLIWTYGGRALDSTVQPFAGGAISLSELAYQTGDHRDFDTAKTALDDAASAATGMEWGAAQKFRIAVTVGREATVKAIVRSIEASVPGLHTFRIPFKTPADAYPRGRIGCVFPQCGDPVTYRRLLSLKNDTTAVEYRFTSSGDIVNDLKLVYGYSAATGTYTRELWFNTDATVMADHGWPVNTHASGTSTRPADLLGSIPTGEIYMICGESQARHGRHDLRLELPYVYRAHEALAIRNNLLRWRCTPRVRLFLMVKLSVMDILPGDVFQLDGESDDFMRCRFPMSHALINAGVASSSWNGKTFLAERVTYLPGTGAQGSQALVQAIFNGKVFY